MRFLKEEMVGRKKKKPGIAKLVKLSWINPKFDGEEYTIIPEGDVDFVRQDMESQGCRGFIIRVFPNSDSKRGTSGYRLPLHCR